MTENGTTVRLGEPEKTGGAMAWFQTNLLTSDTKLGLMNVTNRSLPEIKAGSLKTWGRGDLAIGLKTDLEYAARMGENPYIYSLGLIELKQDNVRLKTPQNVLQLASLSMISRVKHNCAVLATDCASQWELNLFQDENTIVSRRYIHGRKCWEDFHELLQSVLEETRLPQKRKRSSGSDDRRQQTTTHHRPDGADDLLDQDLSGFEDNRGDSSLKDRALEGQARLEMLATALGEIYGERPVVPEWARAENRCPDYYT